MQGTREKRLYTAVFVSLYLDFRMSIHGRPNFLIW